MNQASAKSIRGKKITQQSYEQRPSKLKGGLSKAKNKFKQKKLKIEQEDNIDSSPDLQPHLAKMNSESLKRNEWLISGNRSHEEGSTQMSEDIFISQGQISSETG